MAWIAISVIQHLAVVLFGGHERKVDCVQDVVVADTVFAGRLVDVHVAGIVSRNQRGARPMDEFRFGPRVSSRLIAGWPREAISYR